MDPEKQELQRRLAMLEGMVASLESQVRSMQKPGEPGFPRADPDPLPAFGSDMDEVLPRPAPGDPGLTMDSECASISGEPSARATRTLEVCDVADHSQKDAVRLYGAAQATHKQVARLNHTGEILDLEWGHIVRVDSDAYVAGSAKTLNLVGELQVSSNVLQRKSHSTAIQDGAENYAEGSTWVDVVDFSDITSGNASHADSADSATSADGLALDPETGKSTLNHDELADMPSAINSDHDGRYFRAEGSGLPIEDKNFSTTGEVTAAKLHAGNGQSGTWALLNPTTGNQDLLTFTDGVLTGVA